MFLIFLPKINILIYHFGEFLFHREFRSRETTKAADYWSNFLAHILGRNLFDFDFIFNENTIDCDLLSNEVESACPSSIKPETKRRKKIIKISSALQPEDLNYDCVKILMAFFAEMA